MCFYHWKDGNHPFFEVYCVVFIGCTTAVTRCHSLLFVVTRCHSLYYSLSLFITCCTTRCHSLSLVVLLVVTCCHSLSLVVTRCSTRLSFYKRSLKSLETIRMNEIFPRFACYGQKLFWDKDKDKPKLSETKRRRWNWNNFFKKWYLRRVLITSCSWSFRNNYTVH